MKKFKKLASLFLAALMMLTMVVPVLASSVETKPGNTPSGSGNFTITINDDVVGYTYEAYQIFAGDIYVDETAGTKTLSNITWGSNVDTAKVNAELAKVEGFNVENPAANAKEVAKWLQNTNNDGNGATDSNENAINFAQAIGNCLTGSPAGSTNEVVDTADGKKAYVINPLTAGYYLVQNSVAPSNANKTRYILELVGDVTSNPKRGTVTDEKYIDLPASNGEHTYYEISNAPIGENVSYTIPVQLPNNYTRFKEYYLGFADRLASGLTYNDGSAVVSLVTGTALAGKDVTNKTDVADVMNGKVENVTITEVTTNFNLSYSADTGHFNAWIPNLKDVEGVTDSAWVVLTYTAELNSNAVVGIEGNENVVEIVYSNDPNHEGNGMTNPPDEPDPEFPTGKTPEQNVRTFTTQIDLTKVKDDLTALSGAEFTLTNSDGTKVVLISGTKYVEAGNGAYWKLKSGDYTQDEPTEDTADLYESTEKKYDLTQVLETKSEGEGSSAVSATVNDKTGKLSFTGLGAGTYTLEETVVPAGYNKWAGITFTIGFNQEAELDKIVSGEVKGVFNCEISGDNADQTTITGDQDGDWHLKFASQIVNKRGSLLPSTGGIGTTIFYIVGGVLIVGAGILLVAKKRMSAK